MVTETQTSEEEAKVQAQSALIASAMALTDREFTIRDVRFTVNKLLTPDAFKVLEQLRFAVGDRLKALPADSTFSAYVGLVLSIEPGMVEKLMAMLFKTVSFKTPDQPQALGLLTKEAMAFKDLEPIHYYEVIARCLAVNFFGSLAEIQSRIPMGLISSLLPTET